MVRLKIISGPNTGSTYPLHDGENAIGRHLSSAVVLSSSKVSKRHCLVALRDGSVYVRDAGSANGTFVNGALVSKERALTHGDRISVGDFILEVQGGGNVVALRDSHASQGEDFLPMVGIDGAPVAAHSASSEKLDAAPTETSGDAGMPTDLKGRLFWLIERLVMPTLYGLNFKNEWRALAVGFVAALTLGNLVLSVLPLVESNGVAVQRETERRARLIARQVAEKNALMFAQHTETRSDLGTMGASEDVRILLLTDMDLRIVAPAEKVNSYLSNGPEAVIASRARSAYRQGSSESGFVASLPNDTVISIEPIKIFNPQAARNVVVGMAVVSLDSSIGKMAMGDIGVIYSKALILTGIFAAFLGVLFYRMTLKPFEILNEDLDKALRGELGQVTHEFKFSELNSLWDAINSALQRLPRGGVQGTGGGIDPSASAEALVGALRMLAPLTKLGFVLCDREQKIVEANSIFEEASGIRAEQAVGQMLSAAARDQAFGSLVSDIFGRATPGSAPVIESFDFGGIEYHVHATALGTPLSGALGYVLVMQRTEDAVQAEGA